MDTVNAIKEMVERFEKLFKFVDQMFEEGKITDSAHEFQTQAIRNNLNATLSDMIKEACPKCGSRMREPVKDSVTSTSFIRCFNCKHRILMH